MRDLAEVDRNYQAAKTDPVAAVVLDALHSQDATTYNGLSVDIGKSALDVAEQVRDLVAREERHRLADILEESRELLIESARDKPALFALLLLLMRLDKP